MGRPYKRQFQAIEKKEKKISIDFYLRKYQCFGFGTKRGQGQRKREYRGVSYPPTIFFCQNSSWVFFPMNHFRLKFWPHFEVTYFFSNIWLLRLHHFGTKEVFLAAAFLSYLIYSFVETCIFSIFST